MQILIIEFLCAILATHALRYVLKKIHWIKFSSNRVIGLFIIGVTFSGLLIYYGDRTAGKLTGFSLIEYEKNDALKQAISKEKELNLAGTDYFISDKKNPKDSVNYAAATKY